MPSLNARFIVGKPWLEDVGRVNSCTVGRISEVLTIGAGKLGGEVLLSLAAMPFPNADYVIVGEEDAPVLPLSLLDKIVHSNRMVIVVGEIPKAGEVRDWIKSLAQKMKLEAKTCVGLLVEKAADEIPFDITIEPCCESGGTQDIAASMVDAILALKNVEHPYQMVCVDYADFQAAWLPGQTLVVSGIDSGKERAMVAPKQSIRKLEATGNDLRRATALFVAISGPENLSLTDLTAVMTVIQDAAAEDADIFFSATSDRVDEQIKMTLLVGFSSLNQ